MPRIDQFESVFRAAARSVFEYRPPVFSSVLVVTDLDAEGARAVGDRLRGFLSSRGQRFEARWRDVCGDEIESVGGLLKLVEAETPDLICTYRHLKSDAWQWSYSLGEYLDVLAQETSAPVMVLPHPKAGRDAEHALRNLDVVMAMTDHLDGDQMLVSYAASFVDQGGRLFLAHIEDGQTFDRYMDVISKIPSIDTEDARTCILDRLLKEPRAYIDSCAKVLGVQRAGISVEPIIEVGHRLSAYTRMIESHEVDLLVMHTKDHDQLAMHGVAYPIAVEVRQIPLLIL